MVKKVFVIFGLVIASLAGMSAQSQVQAEDSVVLSSTAGDTNAIAISYDPTRTFVSSTSLYYVASDGIQQYTSSDTPTGSLTISAGNTFTKSYAGTVSIGDSSVLYPTISYSGTNNTNYTKPRFSIGQTVTINTEDVPTDIAVDNLLYPYATLAVDDTGIAYVEYGGQTTLEWTTYGMTSCELKPLNQTGLDGEYTLQNITANTVVTLECEPSPAYANVQIYPSVVTIKVLPPTFANVRSMIAQLQTSSSKKVTLKDASSFVEQAEKAYKAGRLDTAKSFLDKSVASVRRQAGLSDSAVASYEQVVAYLSKTLAVQVDVAPDGCFVTATAPAGYILEYGANYQMRIGYGQQAVIPEGGTITKEIYGQDGWESTGEIVDVDGVVYARDTQMVTTGNCPEPPATYDPSAYNGYPEKWVLPDPGTVVDDWGYENRTAESYVAFKVTDEEKTFPANYGDAADWLAHATADGYVVATPQAGDIAVNTLDVQFGGPVAWYVDSVDDQHNYHMSSFYSSGNMVWSSDPVESSDYIKYIRLP